ILWATAARMRSFTADSSISLPSRKSSAFLPKNPSYERERMCVQESQYEPKGTHRTAHFCLASPKCSSKAEWFFLVGFWGKVLAPLAVLDFEELHQYRSKGLRVDVVRLTREGAKLRVGHGGYQGLCSGVEEGVSYSTVDDDGGNRDGGSLFYWYHAVFHHCGMVDESGR